MSEEFPELNNKITVDIIADYLETSCGDIIQSSKDGNLIAIEKILERHPSDLNMRNDKGETALHWAAMVRMNGRDNVLEYLLRRGSDANAQESALRSTPLHWAVWGGSTRVIAILLEHGAIVDSIDAHGYTSLILCAHLSNVYKTMVLTSNNANLNIQDNAGRTALSWAVTSRSKEVVKELIRSGADVNLRDANGMSPLQYCILNSCDSEIFINLLNAGASPKDMDFVEHLNPIERAGKKKLVKSYKSRLRSSRILNSKKKRITVRISYMIYMSILFVCVYLPLTYLKFGYGLVSGIALASIMSPTVLFIPNMSNSRTTDMSPTVVIFSAILLTSSTIVITKDMCCSYPIALYLLFVGMVVFFLTYVTVLIMNPGIITRVPSEYRKQMVIALSKNGTMERKYFCYTCCVNRPHRSKHCGRCDACVLKFDHHCTWICNCVGKNNYKYFMVLVLSTLFCIVVYAYVSIKYVSERIGKNDYITNTTLSGYLGGAGWLYAILTVIATGVHVIWLPPLILLHIYIAIIRKTSAEFITDRMKNRQNYRTEE